ncbi:MAG: ComEC/Rec2 family competence protein [Verrucomicrobiota bacterium JB022]|nr:ComEC/Rec2 family competence protein [Verrucomicrobiota bacterium JB022]
MDVATSTTNEPGRPFLWRTPLLWVLLPLLAGYIAGEQWPSLPMWVPLVFAIALLGPLAVLTWRDRLSTRAFAGLCLTAIACLSLTYYLDRRAPTLPEGWEGLPPREIVATVQIERLFNHYRPDQPQRGLARLVQTSGVETPLQGYRIVFEWPRGREVELGARYAITGVLAARDAEGGFGRYLERQGVPLALDRLRHVEKAAPPSWFAQAQGAAHDRLRRALMPQGFADTPARRMLAAMLLGETELLPPQERLNFIASGTLHYFAISGLHVAAVAATLDLLLRVLRLRTGTRTITALLLLALYIWATGLAASAVRAGLMIGFWSLATLTRRQAASLPALVGSAVLVLLWDPRQLWTPGFQLSYLVAAGIILYGVPLARWGQERWLLFPWLPRQDWKWHHHWRQNIVRGLWSALSISLAATLASWPLSLLYFEVSSPGAWLLNVVLAPLASLAVAAGVLVVLLGLAGAAPLAHFFAHAAWLLLDAMNRTIALFVSWPLSTERRSWYFDLAGWVCMAGSVGLFFFLIVRKKHVTPPGRIAWFFPVIWSLACIVCLSYRPG